MWLTASVTGGWDVALNHVHLSMGKTEYAAVANDSRIKLKYTDVSPCYSFVTLAVGTLGP